MAFVIFTAKTEPRVVSSKVREPMNVQSTKHAEASNGRVPLDGYPYRNLAVPWNLHFPHLMELHL